jgi:signal transduction histidine kinase/CHASE3 domain sensor protein
MQYLPRGRFTAALYLPVLLLPLVGWGSQQALDASMDAAAWSRHALQVIAQTREVEVGLLGVQNAARSYALTGDLDYLGLNAEAKAKLERALVGVERLTKDNAYQQRQWETLKPLISERVAIAEEVIRARKDRGLNIAAAFVHSGRGKAVTAQVRGILAKMEGEEQRLLTQRDLQARNRAWWARLGLIAGTLLAFALTSVAGAWGNREAKRRELSEAELRHANENLEERVKARTAELQATSEELRRKAEQIQAVTSAARCVLWYADIEDRGGPSPHWEPRMVDEAAAQRVLPVHVAPGESYIYAAYHARIYEDPEAYEALVLERLRQNQGFHSEFRCRLADGTVRWFSEDVHIESVGSGRWWAVGVAMDITERKQLEESLLERTAQIEAMTQQLWQTAKLATMGELAASIAHELNNPLATVSLRVEGLLAQAAPEDPQCRTLEIVEQEVERMGSLVANLLQFSRRTHQQISTLDVPEEIENTLELIRHHLRNRHITVVREFPPDLPKVHADRQQLRQVFLNLFTNASDAMPDGGTLTLRVTANCGVVIEVCDTGTGIPAELLSQVREPFFTTKPDGKGTGLGLSICQRIVQEHQGRFELESEEGKGTTVRIVLPSQNEKFAS